MTRRRWPAEIPAVARGMSLRDYGNVWRTMTRGQRRRFMVATALRRRHRWRSRAPGKGDRRFRRDLAYLWK